MTIIVLLILAGITLGELNDDGIIRKSQEAANSVDDIVKNDQGKINDLLNEMHGIMNDINGGEQPIIGDIYGKVTWSTDTASLELNTEVEEATIQYQKIAMVIG